MKLCAIINFPCNNLGFNISVLTVLTRFSQLKLTGLFTLITAVPGKPTGVTLQEAIKDYMVLGWNVPANNGGADIRGFFVDYRTVKGGVAGKWHEMNHQALTTTSYKVSFKFLQAHIHKT